MPDTLTDTPVPGKRFYNPDSGIDKSTNVPVILSEDLENSTINKVHANYFAEVIERQMKFFNLRKVKGFLNLEQNWNDNGAHPFTEDVVGKAKHLLLSMDKQPEVFPTGRGSIQFEFEKDNDDYLEFEIFHDVINMFFMDDDNELEKQISTNDIIH